MNGAGSANPPAGRVSFPRVLRLILWARLVTIRSELAAVRKKSRLMLAVLAAFCLGYLAVGYYLFYGGLLFLRRFPVVGSLLAQRLLFLIFGFFFAMLVFSNAIIGYANLFRNRETNFLLSLPIRPRDIYLWKILESLVFASWALLFLSAPMMVAWGRVGESGLRFYPEVFVAFIPFVIIPAQIGSWLVLLIVRFLNHRWAKRALAAGGALAVAWVLISIHPVTSKEAAQPVDQILSYEALLRHTRLSLSPILPSAWMAQTVLAWTDGLFRKGAFFFLVMLSTALMTLLVSYELAGRTFAGSWSAAIGSRARRIRRRSLRAQRKTNQLPRLEAIWRAVPAISRPVKALALKDARLFARDPTQWTQFLIFFGLLSIYVLNLRNVSLDYQSRFWEALISHLNLAASTLTLSTLTTRFVFPQFSLEGRRLWIIGLSPIGMSRVLMQKFTFSCMAAMLVTVSLMTASSMMLRLPLSRIVFFDGAIALPAAALCGLAVGLGALFPNLKEDNPSKIVSGFGGTLCLVISFVYIVVYVTLIAVPGLRQVTHIDFLISDSAALALAALCSGAMAVIPLFLAIRRVKNLEF
jgi:ABC-2 type transport system permease protein